MHGSEMTMGELVDRLWVPLSVAIVLLGGLAAYLLLRSKKLDELQDKPGKTESEIEFLVAAREALRQSRKILLRTTVQALLLVLLLFAAVYLLNEL